MEAEAELRDPGPSATVPVLACPQAPLQLTTRGAYATPQRGQRPQPLCPGLHEVGDLSTLDTTSDLCCTDLVTLLSERQRSPVELHILVCHVASLSELAREDPIGA